MPVVSFVGAAKVILPRQLVNIFLLNLNPVLEIK
jgi:hypothetical protein